uniref:Uncharacterized protein n=1 Tax=Cannabis sativa TaxID=3483 RepID=A0A803Q035_CANSA
MGKPIRGRLSRRRLWWEADGFEVSWSTSVDFCLRIRRMQLWVSDGDCQPFSADVAGFVSMSFRFNHGDWLCWICGPVSFSLWRQNFARG